MLQTKTKELIKYCMTDFFPWEMKVLIPQLQQNKKFVYSMIDTGGTGFIIGHGCVNRFGYVVTDCEIKVPVNDKDFYKMELLEDCSIVEKERENFKTEIETAKEEYRKEEKDIQKIWHEIAKQEHEAGELQKKYPLFKNYGRRKIPAYNDGRLLFLQYISLLDTEENEMNIGYFIKDKYGRPDKSRTITVPRGCHTNKWLRAIEKKECLSGRKYHREEF